MRDPNRLDSFYQELLRVHKKYFPDFRFGQLCSVFFGWLYDEKKVDLFFPEEDRMLEFLKEFVGENND